MKLLLTFMAMIASVASLPVDTNVTLERIAYGSCAGMLGKTAYIYKDIADYSPQAWFWLGDVAYVDNFPWGPTEDRDEVQRRFNVQKYDKNYQRILANSQVTGIWDDHDYNQNDGTKYNPTKDWVKDIFLNFLDEPKDSPRWDRDGLYTSYVYGLGKKTVKLIFLDVRYNADYPDEPNADQLGENQWKWLEEEVANDTATFTLVVAGIEVLPDDRIIQNMLYPSTRERLFTLLGKYQLPGVVILSGDIHVAIALESPCPMFGMKYKAYEFTSSGLSHTIADHFPAPFWAYEAFFPPTWPASDMYVIENFASIEFDWNNEADPSLTVDFRTLGNRVLHSRTLHLSDLTPDESYDSAADTECIINKYTADERFWNNVYSNVKKPWGMMYYTICLAFVVIPIILAVVFAIRLFGLVKRISPWSSKKDKTE